MYLYDEYVNDIKYFLDTSPFESTFQRVVENALKDTIKAENIQLIISDKFPRCHTERHCVSAYKENETASPDLLLAKNFIYANSKKKGELDKSLSKTEIYVYIEVKMPGEVKVKNGNIAYNAHDKNQIETYLNYSNNGRVIVTDLYTWVFYNCCCKNKEKIIRLYKDKKWDEKELVKLYDFLKKLEKDL